VSKCLVAVLRPGELSKHSFSPLIETEENYLALPQLALLAHLWPVLSFGRRKTRLSSANQVPVTGQYCSTGLTRDEIAN